MYQAAISEFPKANAAILCAAVADFKPTDIADQKIKRESDDLLIRFQPTHDIAAALGEMKNDDQILVGFALETNDEETHARQKLAKKNLDFIVLNSLRNEGTCFQSDENQICIISNDDLQEYPRKKKAEVAADIIDELYKQLAKKGENN